MKGAKNRSCTKFAEYYSGGGSTEGKIPQYLSVYLVVPEKNSKIGVGRVGNQTKIRKSGWGGNRKKFRKSG